jgi:hypothetical protein
LNTQETGGSRHFDSVPHDAVVGASPSKTPSMRLLQSPVQMVLDSSSVHLFEQYLAFIYVGIFFEAVLYILPVLFGILNGIVFLVDVPCKLLGEKPRALWLYWYILQKELGRDQGEPTRGDAVCFSIFLPAS